jgi:hypothetical protein
MKMYEVSIDNNPGGWKQGKDQSIIVLAIDENEAINKVKNNEWGEYYEHDSKSMIIGSEGHKPYILNGAIISAYEIKFEGYDVVIGIKNIRKKKLDKLNENRYEI